MDVDCLSTGCKTVLNVLYFPDKIFCMKECGENALEVLYALDQGAVYSDYAMIPFNITILTGASGVGKTASFTFMKECMAINPDIVCLNYLDYQKDIKEIICNQKGKLIVIDNADIILNDATRKYISLDDQNQYLIIGRNPKNLFATEDNLFELVSKQMGEQTEFCIRRFL